jgi:hypothetical protein
VAVSLQEATKDATFCLSAFTPAEDILKTKKPDMGKRVDPTGVGEIGVELLK